jgi:hypothetical protein
MESGSVLLEDREPVQIVPARRGRCLLILSAWSLEPNTDASAGINLGDETTDGSAAGGFVPNGVTVLELATEDELWAAARVTPSLPQTLTWIELYD